MTDVDVRYEPDGLRDDEAAQRCLRALLAMYAARGPDAVAALQPVLDDGFTFTPAGTAASALQETYVGPAGFARFLARQAALTADSWWPELQSITVRPDVIVADVVARPRRIDGLSAEFRIEHRWGRRGDTIVDFASHTTQQDAYDRFHARGADELRPPER